MDYNKLIQDTTNTITNFRQQNPNWVVIIRGATATGKTSLSVELTKYFDSEIISSDSRQLFRKMDIWTDKISHKIRDQIPHHLIDIINPDEHFTAWQRKITAQNTIQEIQSRWKLAIIVGWTGLYIDTLYKNYTLPQSAPNYDYRNKLEAEEIKNPWILHKKLLEIDPQEAAKIHPNSTRYLVRALEIYHETWQTKTEVCKEQPVQRPLLMIGLRRDKETTNKLIDIRIKEMLKQWLIAEVKQLLTDWYHKELQAMQWIGYKETVAYLEGNYTIEQLEQEIQKTTYHLAKKQRTRFRRYIKDAEINPKKNVSYKIYEL